MVKEMISDTELEKKIHEQYGVIPDLSPEIIDRIVFNATNHSNRAPKLLPSHFHRLAISACLLFACITGTTSGYHNRPPLVALPQEDVIYQQAERMLFTSSMMEP
jgi:hypothetical protein